MKLSKPRPLEYVVIDDFYNNDELDLIWREIQFLSSKLLSPERTGSARQDGRLLKNNSGIFLDAIYADRNVSDILRLNRKLWAPEIRQEVEKISPWWRLLGASSLDHTLLSYYQDQQYYEPHTDNAVITAVTVLHTDPKNFTGGEFVFPDHDVTIPCKSNSLIIFCSAVKHAVNPVKMLDASLPCSGRYSLAQLLYFPSVCTIK